jgi:hypothetical protein
VVGPFPQVEQLANSIREVYEMFQDFATLVAQQHEQIDSIETTVKMGQLGISSCRFPASDHLPCLNVCRLNKQRSACSVVTNSSSRRLSTRRRFGKGELINPASQSEWFTDHVSLAFGVCGRPQQEKVLLHRCGCRRRAVHLSWRVWRLIQAPVACLVHLFLPTMFQYNLCQARTIAAGRLFHLKNNVCLPSGPRCRF